MVLAGTPLRATSSDNEKRPGRRAPAMPPALARPAGRQARTLGFGGGGPEVDDHA
jgi:hypothetical protein